MTLARRYDDPCGIARALDLIGDRWALLLVRELMYGPKRFSHLREGLPGVSQTVLAQRLRDLEAANVARRVLLGRPADVAAYELTERGLAIKPILLELGRWGSRTAQTSDGPMSPSALVLALETCFDPNSQFSGEFNLDLEGESFQLHVEDGVISAIGGRFSTPDATVTTGVETLRAIAFGRQPIDVAEAEAKLTISGSRSAALSLCNSFLAPNGW
jgi:DNA-binding HxlR family transcriptional regulator